MSDRVTQMTEEQTKLFVGLMFAERAPENAHLTSMTADEIVAYAEQEGLMSVFTFAVLAKRLTVAQTKDVRYSFHTILFLASLCKTPGEAVLWAWSLYRASIRANPAEAITVARLADYFPMGFPNEAAIEEAWDAQKGADIIGGNRLDTEEAWA